MITTPALGIINAHDRPHQNMVAVIYGSDESSLKWSYVAPGSGRSVARAVDDLNAFTPLHHFGVKYGMTSDGRLFLKQFTISIAKTPDGVVREWQGSTEVIIDVMHSVSAKVLAAVRLRHGPSRTSQSVASR